MAEAKANNMPKDNVERAIKRGTGELEGVSYEEITYEGYGPGGVALMVEVMTDNSNRTTPEIRHMLEKNGGNMGTPGSVRFQFERKGYFSVDKKAADEDKLMEIALEAGADDLALRQPRGVRDLRLARELRAGPAGAGEEQDPYARSEARPDSEEPGEARREQGQADDPADGVARRSRRRQNVWSNFDIPDEMMEADE